MKKLLFISSRPIFPIIGGDQIRTFQSLRLLCQHFQIHIVIITSQKETEEVNLQYLKYGSYTSFKISKWKHFMNSLRFIFNRLPIQVNYYYFRKIQKYIDSIISSYDLVFCNNIRTSEYVRKYSELDKIIDYVDAISMNYEKARFHAAGLMNWIYNIDYHRCMNYESIILKEFQGASIISSVDKQYILSHSVVNKDICIVGNMVECNKTKYVCNRESNKIVFVGKMNYEPNILAVCNFVKYIYPIIKKVKPDLIFYIVGASPCKTVLNLDNSSDIIVTGFVPNVDIFFATASIVVAPMLSGAGIQNKIIQAMSLEACVVTTSIGAEGLSILDNEISIIDGNENIAQEIIRLLNNKLEREDMGRKAKLYVETHLTFEAISQQFNQLISPFQ